MENKIKQIVQEELEKMGKKVESVELKEHKGINPRTKEEIIMRNCIFKCKEDRERSFGWYGKEDDEIREDVKNEFEFGELDDYDLIDEFTSLDDEIKRMQEDERIKEELDDFLPEYIEQRKHLLGKGIRFTNASSNIIYDWFDGEIFIDKDNKIIDRIGY